MRSLRLTNFRSFTDTQRITLKPITVLVGANSSGKSSYLRFFPLLRQTAETTTLSPLLWFGTLVDFGDFSKAVSRNANPSALGFAIETDIRIPGRRGRRTEHTSLPVAIDVQLRANATQTYVSELKLTCNKDTCRLSLNEKNEIISFAANDLDVLALCKASPKAVPSPFVPTLSWKATTVPGPEEPVTPIQRSLANLLREFSHNRTKDETLLFFARNYLSYGSPKTVLAQVASLKLRHLAAPTETSPEFRKIHTLIFAKDLDVLLRRTQRTIAVFASGINYLGPFRTNPERFYRQQELSIGQIEPHGENLAMFLRSLSAAQLSDLSRFVDAYLDFSVTVEPDGSHVAVIIKDRQGRGFNLIDMGYGFSQVLPVLAQCWNTLRADEQAGREVPTTLLTIEQPELHLHPSHQSRLADMFAAVLNGIRAREQPSQQPEFSLFEPSLMLDRSSFPLRMLIETHSEAMVTRFGELVEKGQLRPEDLTVLLFSKDPESGATSIREATFRSDGTLNNWPLGFFAP